MVISAYLLICRACVSAFRTVLAVNRLLLHKCHSLHATSEPLGGHHMHGQPQQLLHVALIAVVVATVGLSATAAESSDPRGSLFRQRVDQRHGHFRMLSTKYKH